ncbi:cysteine--tRNA ligase [Pseudochrobactrum algeriensis]|uniref:cysteine--tRNA ligase n=1 Tax=Pseudochrobactrum algeriensis TaxID=2834768 RepID=UPI001BCFA4ED|nr:cysteine--tRNA ligase [Pseudochrobactrum algeriensis]MBX8813475.1 cysteine--tRNA ligase [Ochrobactrum sp. MR34]QVQ37674.1 cysteine--tRNA ligase [Pseudochrobactrum algeriensis]QVQ40894.1 cysteine--tRNA ligase [Pseudochrobactrum algeriensis]QVQ44818.1 cysteine--tRNA ligase [Pseudochrobactrum algeriensis]
MSATELRLYNTLTRRKEDFVPINPDHVRMYVCGPTVYDFAHIGNARPVIVFDVLFRLLRHVYGESQVTYARNLTDVDDKINARAVRDYPDLPLNEAIRKVTESTNAQFQSDVTALGNLEPSSQPRATEHLEEMRQLIERLIERGHAYVADDHVLFAVKTMSGDHGPRYGALARRSLDEMIAGARVDVASYKRDEMDFVLWKPSKEGEPGWPSPAGIAVHGRPGWHIECSAMSMAKLLEPFGGGLKCDDPLKNTFDIHAGGIDLVFPHHENEIAQSCCAFGSERMANIWMHNGFLQVEGQKMSKSLGNFITIDDVLKSELPQLSGTDAPEDFRRRWTGMAARLSMLQTHYREPINWTQQRLIESGEELAKWYQVISEQPVAASANKATVFADSIGDDLNTWSAITELRKAYKQGDVEALVSGLNLLGLHDAQLLAEAAQYLFSAAADVDTADVERQISERLAFINGKNWAEADRIRDSLLAQNIQLKDGKDPATGERVTTWEVKR